MCLAIPGKIVSIDKHVDPLLRNGKVNFGGIIKNVNLSLTPEAETNQYVLVHVGSAISIIDEEEARKVFEILKESGDLEEELKWS